MAHSPRSENEALGFPEKKGPWSPEEDERLRQAVGSSQPRPKWAEIANQVEGRSAKQCRERWEQNLSPRLNKDPIARIEAVFVIDFVDEHGKKWAEIARQLTNRSDNNIKNWYNGMVQKGKTGRGSQEEPLRSHFTPEHQTWLSNRVRRPHSSPQMDPRHAHSYSPYGSRPSLYAVQSSSYSYSVPPPVHVYSPQHQRPYQHHYQQHPPQQYERPGGAGLLPPPPPPVPASHRPALPLPEESLRLAPLQEPQRPAQYQAPRSEYLEQHQPSWPSRGLTLQTSSTAVTRGRELRYSLTPLSHRGSSGSLDLPPPRLSGSSSSTPSSGSPVTPAVAQSEVYRHRKSSLDEACSIDYEHTSQASRPRTLAEQSHRMSITNLVN